MQREYFRGGMIWATPDTEDDIQDIMNSTGLTRKTLLQAMSNEQKRYRGEGYSDDDLKGLRVTLGLSRNQSAVVSKVIRLLSIIHSGIILDLVCGFRW